MRKTLSINSTIVFLFAIGLLKILFLSSYGLKMMGDDLQNFAGAARILRGGMPYSDYQAFFPPFTDYLLANILKITDFNIVYSRYFYGVIASLMIPIAFLLTKRLSGQKITVLVTLVFIFADVRLDLLFFHTFFLGSVLFSILYLEERKFMFGLISGGLLAIGSLFRLDFAITFAAGISAMYLLDFFKNGDFKNYVKVMTYFVFLPAFLNLLTVIWLLRKGLLLRMLANVVVASEAKSEYFVNYFSLNYLIPRNFSLDILLGAMTGWLYIYWSVISVIFVIYFFRGSGLKKLNIKQTVIAGILTSLAVSTIYLRLQIDLPHFIKGGILFLPFLATVASYKKSYFLSILATTSLIGLLLIQASVTAWFILSNNNYVYLQKGGGILTRGKFVEGTTLQSSGMLVEATGHLKNASEDEYVFALPHLSMLYYTAGRKNPTMYDNLLAGYLLEPFGEEYVVNRVREENVKYIVYDREGGPKREKGRRLQDYYPKIDAYIMGNYFVVKNVNGWLLMERDD